MQRRWLIVPIGVLVLAGCQVSTRPSGPSAPAPASSTAAPQQSVWQAARERGMAFRAAGDDPGWSVEVQRSRHPTLYVVLDASQRHMQVPDAQAFSHQGKGEAGFRGTAEDGTPVELTIRRGQCQKDMSGHKLAAAELAVGASQYTGCGKFLFQ
jgi:uncharacterized membrane protein